jgi:AraC family transcriptional regulator
MQPLTPDFRDRPAFQLAGIRRVHSFENAPRDIPTQWQEFNALTIPGRTEPGTSYGAICSTDMARGELEYMCGIAVADFSQLDATLGRMRIPAQHYAVFTHTTGIATVRDTWAFAMHQWLPASNYIAAPTPNFELYDGRFDPSAHKEIFEIWLAITPKA